MEYKNIIFNRRNVFIRYISYTYFSEIHIFKIFKKIKFYFLHTICNNV